MLVIHRTEAGHTGAELKVNEPMAYHLFVRKDGTVDYCYDIELKTGHARNFNAHSIGVAVYGFFCPKPTTMDARAHLLNQYPTQAQLDSLDLLCRGLEWWLGRKLEIVGHTELGPQGTTFPEKLKRETSCPGPFLDLDALRERVSALRGEEGETNFINS
jgi:N-acetyl-anhydromuramyl-L-alanine amidase AmpD